MPGFLWIALLSTQAFAAENAAAKQQIPAVKTAHPGVRKSARRTQSSKKRSAYRQAAQQQPTVERYKEIQQALADKGYFNESADGNWGPGSVEALKRFQHDQNLPEDGKIGSLSLIALGLGPKRVVLAQGGDDNKLIPAKTVDPRDTVQEP